MFGAHVCLSLRCVFYRQRHSRWAYIPLLFIGMLSDRFTSVSLCLSASPPPLSCSLSLSLPCFCSLACFIILFCRVFYFVHWWPPSWTIGGSALEPYVGGNNTTNRGKQDLLNRHWLISLNCANTINDQRSCCCVWISKCNVI